MASKLTLVREKVIFSELVAQSVVEKAFKEFGGKGLQGDRP